MGKNKKLYVKPEITCAKLIPEEATLTNCKQAGGSTGAGTNKCLSPSVCKGIGS